MAEDSAADPVAQHLLQLGKGCTCKKSNLYEPVLNVAAVTHLCTWDTASAAGLGAGRIPPACRVLLRKGIVAFVGLCLQSAARGLAMWGTGGAEEGGV